MKVDGVEVVRNGIKQEHAGSGLFFTSVDVVGHLDPYEHKPLMVTSETGFAFLDNQQVYIGDARYLGNKQYEYTLVCRGTIPLLSE